MFTLSQNQLEGISLVMIAVVTVSGLLVNVTRNAKPADLLKSYDAHTILWFRILYPLGIMGAFVCMHLGWGQLFAHPSVPLLGIGMLLYAMGLLLRWIAILSLRKAFTVKISIIENHKLKTDGVYRWMRHPSYTGLLLYYFGLGLVMNNVISLVLLMLVNGITLAQRIPMEERALSDHFGSEWRDFAQKTKRLIPGIY